MSAWVSGRAQDYNPRKFGAVGDGKALDTKAVQAALNAAEKAGGGTVRLSPGRYRCGTLILKSNTHLYLEAGSEIYGSEHITDYIPISWGADGNKDRQPYHLIVARDAHHISITGQGTINGNGKAFWETGKQFFDLPPDSIPPHPEWILAKKERTSPMVEMQNCHSITIENITLTNPSGWTFHLLNCKRANIRGLQILNNLFSPNSDGIDLTGCEDVTVSDCIINTCDDAICIKTSPDGKSSKRIAVSNCVIKTMCVALKLGNESWGDMSQISFTNCIVHQCSRVIGIYARDGGRLEDIHFSNIVGDTRAPFIFNRPIHISLLQPKEGPKSGAIRNVHISNFTCRTDGRVLVTAPDGDSIVNLTLRDIHLIYPRIENPEPLVEGAKSNQFSPGSPEARRAKAAFVIDGVKNLRLSGLMVEWPQAPVPHEWAFMERIEHGGNRRFTPDYFQVRETEFSALYVRKVDGALLDLRGLRPSSASQKQIMEMDCKGIVKSGE